MTESVLKKTIFLKAAPETVWLYLTEPDHLAQWFHKPDQTLKVGADLRMFGRDSGDLLISGQVLTARPPEYLEFSFTITPMGGANSVVKWYLDAVAGGTRLSLEHHGLPQGVDGFELLLALDKGWDGHFGELRTAIHTPVSA